jgi:hypothetical protein
VLGRNKIEFKLLLLINVQGREFAEMSMAKIKMINVRLVSVEIKLLLKLQIVFYCIFVSLNVQSTLDRAKRI